jgi:hypothetical protein
LKALVDEGSFRKGIGNITSMRDGLADLIKTGLGILGVTVGLKELIKAATEQGQMLITARYINMTADALQTWNGVMAEAGGNSDALINSLGDLNAAFVEMQTQGMPASNQLMQDLAQLGLKPQEEIAKNSDQRAKDILSHGLNLMKTGTPLQAGMAMQIVNRLLGGQMGGLQAMMWAFQHNETMEGMYSGSAARAIPNPYRQGGAEGASKLREVGEDFHDLFGRFSSKVLEELKPTLERLVNWLSDPVHKEQIEKLTDGLVEFAKAVTDFILSPVLLGLAEGMAILSGHPEIAQEMIAGKVAREGNAPWATWMQTAWANINDTLSGVIDNISKFPSSLQAIRTPWGSNLTLPSTPSPLTINITDKTKGGVKVDQEGVGFLRGQMNVANQMK